MEYKWRIDVSRIFGFFLSMHIALHALLALGVFGLFQIAKSALDASYAASKHPVDYATGQTTFDAAQIKGFYQAMQDSGTLDIYVRTQIIDFGFIVAMALMGLTFGTLVARLAREASIGRKLALWAALSVMCGTLMDTLENLVSFVMLAQPLGFADWLALPYCGFAVTKFALITLGMALLVGALISAALGRLLRRPRLG